jgi:hypothetical protein
VGEEHAVGGDGDVFDALDGGQHGDEIGEAAAEEWLTSREADFLDAQRDEGVNKRDDFLEAQKFIFWEKCVGWPENFDGHAIAASEIAAVRDGNPQISQAAPESIHWNVHFPSLKQPPDQAQPQAAWHGVFAVRVRYFSDFSKAGFLLS